MRRLEPPVGGRGIVSFAILGCGSRGRMFARWIAEHPGEARVVAVADVDEGRRRMVAEAHGVGAEMQFGGWEELLGRPRLADAVINSTMDRLHAASGVRALELGYHMLLEKPMAVTMEDCVAIDAARRRSGRIVSVCHSLRYHPCYARIKQILDEGTIGRIVSIDQLEGVDPQHQSHSFVRGNWGNESRSAFMLLTKSCHDMDVLCWLVGRDCRRVSSFGGLSHFRKENRPAGAPGRCVEGCAVSGECPYDAVRLYAEGKGYARFLGLQDMTAEQRMEFLRTSNYGRCAYDVDNDVVDHQVLAMEFEGGATGTFTMTAFAPGGRRLRIHGTHGYIQAEIDRNQIELCRFWGAAKDEFGKLERIEVAKVEGGHGGGDANVMECLVKAIREDEVEAVLTGTEESLKTHAVAFAGEVARREGRVVEVGVVSY